MTDNIRLREGRERSPCLSESGSRGVTMWGTRRVVALDALMACWGLGTWLGVNGLYVQLPLLVERLPEGWALPASMALAVQLANVGMLLYAVSRRLFPRTKDAHYIYGLLVVGTLALTLNAFLYTHTSVVGSAERSVPFLTLTFFAALVGCTSSVLFYPFLRHFRDIYLVTYLVGEGLSGFVPSILALIQGVGMEPECRPSADNSTVEAHYDPPRFSSTVFLLILGALSALSLLSFAMVQRLSAFDSERVSSSAAAKNDEATTEPARLRSARWVSALALTGCLNALSNGVMPSVQSYSCMPYGTRAYHLAVTLSAMANPAACLAGVWLRPLSVRSLAALLSVAAAPLSYLMVTAALSPRPPLRDSAAGEALVVLAWVLTSAAVSYARMWLYGWARSGGPRGMRACGAATQLGSALGSLVLFALVNYARVFEQPEVCSSAELG